MKILVLSDTHGEIDGARSAIALAGKLDMIIHLGDYFRDAQSLSDMYPGIPVEYVYGNSDFMIGEVECEKLLDIEGKRIFITHGHRYSVKWDYEKLYKKAEDLKADVLLFGHTHVAELITRENHYIINPGSISDPRDGTGESYAVIEIKDGKIKPDIIYI